LAIALISSAAPAADRLPPAPVAARYQIDHAWPKRPLPNNWAIGGIAGFYVDTRDHVWVSHWQWSVLPNVANAAATPPRGRCCIPAPHIMEFDPGGNIVRTWGGPGEGYDWPSNVHGVYVDYKGSVWIGGSKTRVGEDGVPPDGMLLKFSPDGKFLLQIGKRGPSKGSLDPNQLSGASNVAVDPKTNEAFISDGYGNHRVLVVDADTGAFKRQWGAYGKPPTDLDIGPYDPKAPPAPQFRIVHCIRLANDGLLYVCDRLNNRVQVFKTDGTFVKEFIYDRETLGSGSVGTISFWPDAAQSVMAINDPGNFQVRFVRRDDGQVLGTFGHYGTQGGEFDRNHEAAFDSRGNIYVSDYNRVQRFKMAPESR
jgi:DNA-binding beta-propeller fold protein YncE